MQTGYLRTTESRLSGLEEGEEQLLQDASGMVLASRDGVVPTHANRRKPGSFIQSNAGRYTGHRSLHAQSFENALKHPTSSGRDTFFYIERPVLGLHFLRLVEVRALAFIRAGISERERRLDENIAMNVIGLQFAFVNVLSLPFFLTLRLRRPRSNQFSLRAFKL